MLAALATTLAQITYSYTTDDTAADGGSAAGYIIFGLIVMVVMIAAMWRIFTKARKPGWAALIPIYHTYVLLKIVSRPWWWLLLFFVPLVNIIVGIVVYYDLVKAFGKGVGWLLLVLFVPFIGFPALAFGKSRYTAPKR